MKKAEYQHKVIDSLNQANSLLVEENKRLAVKADALQATVNDLGSRLSKQSGRIQDAYDSVLPGVLEATAGGPVDVLSVPISKQYDPPNPDDTPAKSNEPFFKRTDHGGDI